MKTYLVNEIFYSISGEGPYSGTPTVFVRFFGCNCRCSYCDSMYALEGSDHERLTAEQICNKIADVSAMKSPHIILTGGEPLLQVDKELFEALNAHGYFSIEVETNGAVDIPEELYPYASWTVDYKSLFSDMNSKMKPGAFSILCNSPTVCGSKHKHEDCVKCVIANRGDYEDFKKFVNSGILKEWVPKYLSPVFGEIEPKQIVEWMLEDAADTTWHMQIQMHKVIWDPNKRGV